MANLPRSLTIHLRPSFSATEAVVPERYRAMHDEALLIYNKLAAHERMGTA